MSLSSIRENAFVADQLKSAIRSDRVSHAYLFVGPPDVRRSLALEFAKAILCPESPDDSCGRCRICRKVEHGNHEDLLIVEKSGNSIRKESIEDIITALSFKSFGSRKIVVMDEAHAMTQAAQNKLLKTLEEPAGPTVILLLAERKDALFDTILSRCVTYQLQENVTAIAEAMVATARQWIALCAADSPFYRRVELLEPYLAQRESCLEWLDVTEDLLRDLLLSANGAGQAGSDAAQSSAPPLDARQTQRLISEVEAARKSLKLSYNIGYAMKNLCLRANLRRDLEE